MAITTSTSVQIMIEDNGVIILRQSKQVFDDDGTMIGERSNRLRLEPGANVSDQPAVVQRIANAVWTAAVIDRFKQQQAENLKKILGQG